MSEIVTKAPSTMTEYVSQQMELVTKTMAEREIIVPKGYALKNGLMSAMFAIQNAKDKDGKPALQVVTKESVQKFLLEVAQNGLYLNKGHGYCVIFADQAVLLTSYMGEVAKAKQNDTNIKDIFAEVVYKDDVFKYQIKQGHKVVTVHEQEPDNIDPAKIKGSYATVVYHDGSEVSEYMPLEQIKKSWAYGQTKGTSKAHQQSTDEMCKKTVLRRLAKMINATNNDSLYDTQLEEIEDNIDAKANTQVIDIGGDDTDSGYVDVFSDADMDSTDCERVETIDDLEQIELVSVADELEGSEVFDL